ncbi:N2,N2-dimethylguanosine tRNA methyltransferase, partial [Pseudoloma neurophilia]
MAQKTPSNDEKAFKKSQIEKNTHVNEKVATSSNNRETIPLNQKNTSLKNKGESKNSFIQESTAKILQTEQVFYNHAQKINRDLSVLVIEQFLKDLKNKKQKTAILEAMSATGLRGIRYFKELSSDFDLFLNDLDPKAVETIQNNLELNGIEFIRHEGNKKFLEHLEIDTQVSYDSSQKNEDSKLKDSKHENEDLK